jgi:hypothetical protein
MKTFGFVEYALQEYVLKSLEMVAFNKSLPVLIIIKMYVTVKLLGNDKCEIY